MTKHFPHIHCLALPKTKARRAQSERPNQCRDKSQSTKSAAPGKDSPLPERECAAFHKLTGRIIKLVTVQEILDEERVRKM